MRAPLSDGCHCGFQLSLDYHIKKIIVLLALVVGIDTSIAFAMNVKLTIYDDGRSCPNNCDAHVVFHPSLNGSPHAHKPDTEKTKCASGENCEICFDDSPSNCISVMYRGPGPGRQTFDFTPSFYKDWCDRENNPPQLVTKCESLKKLSDKLAGQINCIETLIIHLVLI